MNKLIINLIIFIVIAVIAGVWIFYGYIHYNPFCFVGTDYTPSQHGVESGFLGIVVSIVLTPIVRVVWFLYKYY